MGQALKQQLKLSTSVRSKSSKENYIMEETLHREGIRNLERKHCSSSNHIYNHFQSIYTRTDLLELCQGQIYLDNSGPFLFDYLLKSIITVIPFIRVQFSNSLSTNSLYCPFLFDYLLKSIITVIPFIRAQFSNSLSTNSLF